MIGNIDTLKNAREWKTRLTQLSTGRVYDETMVSSFTLQTQQDTSKLIGQTVGRQLELIMMTTHDADYSGLLKLEVGLKCWNEELQKYYYEWMSLGQTFLADSIEQENLFTTKVTCFDAMVYKFEGKYLEGSNLDETTTLTLQNHIAQKFGVTFDTVVPNFTIANPYGETFRDLIGYLAIVCGCNAHYSVLGDVIKFTPLVKAKPDLVVSAQQYFEFKDERSSFTVKKLNLDMGGGFGYYSGNSDATEDEEVIVKLPFATQEIANYVYGKIKDFSPVGYSMKYMGQPQLEPYDVVQLTTADLKIYNLHIGSSKLTYNGGLSQELSYAKMTSGTTDSKGSYVENKLTSKINVLADRITMEVADLTDEIEQAKSSIIQTKDEILQTVENTYLTKQEVSKLYSVVLTNEFQSIPTNSLGFPIENGTFECLVKVYNATEEITNFELSVGATNSYGITVSVNKPKIIFTYDKTRQITANSDNIDVTIKVGDDIISKQISWCLAKQGTDGTSFNIKGTLESVDNLPTDVEVGDGYIINGDLYIFSEDGEWVNAGKIQGEDGKMSTCNIMSNSLTFRSGDGGETWTPSAIVLTPYITEANWLNWKYYDNGEWKSHERLATEVITIAHNDDLISNNQLTLRCNTDVDGCFDIVTLQKLSVLDDELETIKTIAKSEISQTAEQILSTVSSTYLKKDDADNWVTYEELNSAIDQKADEITISVKSEVIEEIEVGAVNLVLNSAIEETSAQYGFAERELCEKLIDGKSYTLSVNGRNNSSTGKLRVYIRDDANSFSKYIDITEDKDITKSITFEAPNGSSNKTFKITAYLYPSGSTETVTVNWYKLERGNIATDWSPCPKDTDLLISNAIEDLESQLDGKIQTYYQPSDPSTAWTDEATKTQHTGDLWYDINSVKMKRWNGISWVEITDKDASDAKKLASTKAQVFTSTPTPPYYKGDMWCRASDEEIMRSKANRTSGSYVASDWIKASKYTDDTVANEVKNDLATNYYTKTETNAQIKVAKDSITSTVSETYTTKDDMDNTLTNYAKKSDLSQTADSITATFTSSGGGNLVRNGELKNGNKFWTEHAYQLAGSDLNRWWQVQNNEWTGYEPSLEVVIADMSSGQYGVRQSIETVVGRQYVLTCYLAGHRGNYRVIVRGTTSSESAHLKAKDYGFAYGGSNPDDWYQVVIPFVAQRTKTTIEFDITSSWDAEEGNTHMWVKRVMVCEGTVWTPFVPHSSEVYTGITKIDQDGIEVSHSNISTKSQMTASGFFINDKNGDVIAELSSANQWSTLKADEVFANNIDNIYMGDANLYVDHSKTVAGSGTSSSPFNNFKALADYLQATPILKKDLVINVTSTGNVTDHLDLRGIRGNGTIKINLAKTLVLNKSSVDTAFYFYGCDVAITINGGRTSYSSTDGALINGFPQGIFFNQCKYGVAEYLAIDTSKSGSTQWGVVFRNTNGRTNRVDFCDTYNALLVDSGSNVSDHDSCGNCTNVALVQSGANLVIGSTQDNGYKPMGSYIRNVGCITDLGNRTATASKRKAPAVPPTSDKWQSFSFSDYGYYSVGQACWNPYGKKVYQGEWSGYGNNRGIFTLPNSSINTYLSGATILDGSTITLKRANSGGYSSAQSIYLCGTTCTTIGSGTPAVTKTYGSIGTLAWGQQKTFTLPKAFVQDLKAGTIKSVMFYTSDGSNYILFDTVCTLNIKVNK